MEKERKNERKEKLHLTLINVFSSLFKFLFLLYVDNEELEHFHYIFKFSSYF